MKDYKLKQRNLRASHTLGKLFFCFLHFFSWLLSPIPCFVRFWEKEGRNDSVEENYTGEEATMAMTKAARDHDDLANLTNVQPHAPHALIFYLNTQ
jgi:hypothetical protein